jgi:hypothetical protein
VSTVKEPKRKIEVGDRFASHLRSGCGTCNIAKQAMELPVFLAWVERVYAHSVASRKTENIVRIVF